MRHRFWTFSVCFTARSWTLRPLRALRTERAGTGKHDVVASRQVPGRKEPERRTMEPESSNNEKNVFGRRLERWRLFFNDDRH
jgi:hypothetical protein